MTAEDHATVTLAEAAFRLGISERTLRKRIAAGTLAATKQPLEGGGSAWQIPVSALPPTPERGGSVAEGKAEGKAELLTLDTEATSGAAEGGTENKTEALRKQDGRQSEGKTEEFLAVAGEVHLLRNELEQLKGVLLGGAMQALNKRLEALPDAETMHAMIVKNQEQATEALRETMAQAVKAGITEALAADAQQQAETVSKEDVRAILEQFQKLQDANARLSGELAELREDRQQKRGFFARLFGGG